MLSVAPTARSIGAPLDAAITVRFDRPVMRSAVNARTFWAFGRWNGPVRDGQYTFSDGDATVTLKAPRAWPAGDRVTVILSHDLKGADGAGLRAAGFSFQFWTTSAPGPLVFGEIARFSTRSDPTVATLTYGASATDLNGDGFLDLLTVNERTADLRIFLNMGDGSGQFRSFVRPTTPLAEGASPSETADFNGDGITDLVTSNGIADNIAILFGNGNGTFTLSQRIPVGPAARGVAVLDVDGDGDIDIVNSNADGDNLSLLRNDGTGLFPAEKAGITFFDAGHGMATVSQEYGLMTGDMDEDGVLDLVIGARGLNGMNTGLAINRGKGDGSFQFASFQGPPSMAWQLAVGDLDGDGHEDVATADGIPNSTLTLFKGDGAGAAQLVHVYSMAQDAIPLNFPTAVDLGDLDGDGDLDVAVSNYGSVWELLKNDGRGGLTPIAGFPAAGAASCAVLIDIDNDHDLDVALIDENADQLIILQQQN